MGGGTHASTATRSWSRECSTASHADGPRRTRDTHMRWRSGNLLNVCPEYGDRSCGGRACHLIRVGPRRSTVLLCCCVTACVLPVFRGRHATFFRKTVASVHDAGMSEREDVQRTWMVAPTGVRRPPTRKTKAQVADADHDAKKSTRSSVTGAPAPRLELRTQQRTHRPSRHCGPYLTRRHSAPEPKNDSVRSTWTASRTARLRGASRSDSERLDSGARV